MDKQPLKPKPEKHLVNLLAKTRGDHNPNFALLLGAGASITSGVDPAGEMIDEWRKQHHEIYGEDEESLEKYLDRHPWHNSPEEYSYLFESLYDQPSQRREYVESCLDDAFPSWGYIYLTSLVSNNVFNVVLTTNFDDLLNEACYQFSDIRPMVCAHDSSIRSLRITSERPKIIKLHGDFLFDDIKNTVIELETLESNVREKLKQIASEFGLIVVGYAGNDRSVMDSLNALLKNEANFPHGIYWCVKNGDESRSPKLDALLRHPQVHLIKIEGFDELFANMHDKLELDMLPELSDPYQNLTDKLNELLEDTGVPDTDVHPVIKRDIAQLGEKLRRMAYQDLVDPDETNSVKISAGKSIVELPIPYSLLSQISEREGDSEKALVYMERQLQINPRTDDFTHAFKLLRKYNAKEKVHSVVQLLRDNCATLQSNPGIINNFAVDLISMEEYKAAEDVLQITPSTESSVADDPNLRLNKIQIFKHQGERIPEEDLSYLDRLRHTELPVHKLAALILLEEKEEAIPLLEQLLNHKVIAYQDYEYWPIFKLLPVTLSVKEGVYELSDASADAQPVTKKKKSTARKRAPKKTPAEN